MGKGKKGNFQNKNSKKYQEKLQEKWDLINNAKNNTENRVYELYYKEILKEYFENDKKEWDTFWEWMKMPLENTFRINPVKANYQNYVDRIKEGDGAKIVKEFYKEQLAVFDQQIETIPNDKSRKFDNEQEKQKCLDSIKQRKEQLVEFVEKNQGRFKQLEWIDNTFQINSNKINKIFKNLNQEISLANEVGLLTRQELVSMIPPLILNPEPQDTVLDLCAAPGSKTCQLLEIMHNKGFQRNEEITGFVMSNELNEDRCHILSHRLNRNGGSKSTVTVNHYAQFTPEYKDQDGKNYRFDKVLADVPCTGDGIARKASDMWIFWTTMNALQLYPVQLSILIRSLQLVKAGGYVVYSTCSISPIEDEAVLQTAFMKSIPGTLELVDCHSIIPKFKGRKGLNNWKVSLSKIVKAQQTETSNKTYEEMFQEFESYEEVQKYKEEKTPLNSQLKLIEKAQFSQGKEFLDLINIQNSMRCLSHDNDTGGFFIALLKKRQDNIFTEESIKEENFNTEKYMEEYKKNIQIPIGEMDLPQTLSDDQIIKLFDSNDKEEQKLREIQKKDFELTQSKQFVINTFGTKKHSQVYEIYEPISDIEYKDIDQLYGLKNLQKNQLIASVKGIHKKVKIVSKKLGDFLAVKENNQYLNCINAGQKIFAKEGSGFRIQKEGMQWLLPYITQKKMEVDVDTLLQFVGKQMKIPINAENIKNEKLLQYIETLPNQETVILYTQVKGNTQLIAIYKYNGHILSTLSIDEIKAFNLLYKLNVEY